MADAGREAFRCLEREGWERVAPLFVAHWESLTSLFVDALLDGAAAGPGVSLLDVGCGPGLLAAAAAARGARVVGCDASPSMVRAARERFPDLDVRVADAEDLPFAPESFDRVTMSFTVHHLADPERAFSEARRVLAPGGLLAFAVWAPPEENPGARIVDEALRAHADLTVPVPEGPPRDLYADPAGCRRTLARAGFEATSVAARTHRADWLLRDADMLFQAELRAGVRTTALLARQTPERLAAVRAAMAAGVKGFAVPGGYAIPMTALMLTARAAL